MASDINPLRSSIIPDLGAAVDLGSTLLPFRAATITTLAVTTLSGSPAVSVLITSPKFTTTGVGSVPGYTLAAGENIGVASGANIAFNGAGGQGLFTFTGATLSNTSSSNNFAYLQSSFAPASGSGSYGTLQLNPTINGVSSGTAYALGVASKTNTLTGGAIKLASFGTTTTDLFTGYTALVEITVAGVIDIKTGGSTTISTGVGSVRMSSANAATNTSWIPLAYNGTTYFVPGWTTNNP